MRLLDKNNNIKRLLLILVHKESAANVNSQYLIERFRELQAISVGLLIIKYNLAIINFASAE